MPWRPTDCGFCHVTRFLLNTRRLNPSQNRGTCESRKMSRRPAYLHMIQNAATHDGEKASSSLCRPPLGFFFSSPVTHAFTATLWETPKANREISSPSTYQVRDRVIRRGISKSHTYPPPKGLRLTLANAFTRLCNGDGVPDDLRVWRKECLRPDPNPFPENRPLDVLTFMGAPHESINQSDQINNIVKSCALVYFWITSHLPLPTSHH